MAKKIDASAHIGDAGIALIHQLVNDMGFVWHARTIDAGIDGMIELRDPTTGAVCNRHLLVQSKASELRFPGENERSFTFQCKEPDINYWMRANQPVLLICSHPSTRQAWWVHVQPWFSDPARRASRRITFDKVAQRLDPAAAPRWFDLADPHGFAHVPRADDRPERLDSNLLEVTHVPDLIFSAKCAAAPGEIIQTSRQHGAVRLDWVRRNGRLYTVRPPDEIGLATVLSGAADVHEAATWVQSGNADQHRLYVQLLQAALRQRCIADLLRHREKYYLYFRATRNLSDRSLRGKAGRSRKVFYGHVVKKTREINYYIHAAVNTRWIDLDGSWFCILSPTLHYTIDGERESAFASELLAGRKRLDKNLAVLGQVQMWARYLRGEEHLLADRDDTLEFGDLLGFDAERGIDDKRWTIDRNLPSPVPQGVDETPDAAMMLFGDVS